MKYENQSIAALLTTSPGLRPLVEKINELAILNRIVLKNLDPHLVPHCSVSNLRDGILILTTSSPTWGHQLRFSSMTLLNKLRENPQWAGLKSIQTVVRPEEITPSTLAEKLAFRRPSVKAAKQVADARCLMSDPHLSQALLKLSTTLYEAAAASEAVAG